MTTNLSDADKRRVQKHKLLQKFETQKKSHMVASFLSVVFGVFGAHRFYLGHKKIGFLILAGYVALFLTMLFLTDESLRETYILPIIIVGIVVILLEIFRTPRLTEKLNEDIKKSLEDEFYT